MKALPPSYTTAIPFSRPRDPNLFVVGDGYGCAVKAQDPGITLPPPAPSIAWGQLISFILQQPALAVACGFVYHTTVTIPPALLTDTSWISFAIDASVATNPFVPDLANPRRHPQLCRPPAETDHRPQALRRCPVPRGPVPQQQSSCRRFRSRNL